MPSVAERWSSGPSSRDDGVRASTACDSLDDADEPSSEWAPSMWVMPLAETPLRPLVHLAAHPGQVCVDDVFDLPEDPPATWWRRVGDWLQRRRLR
ncbi:MAG: hypothetical protein RI907_3975 [Pseudomonadota bacterium]|jgi:hypothetical protein